MLNRRILSVLTIAVLAAGALTVTACSKKAQEPAPTTSSSSSTTDQQSATTQPAATETPATTPAAGDATALKIQDLKVGTGAEAVAGKTVTVHYTGWLTDGTKFDSSLDSGQPFTFVLGAGQVIVGWDKGVAGMKVGGKRKLTIPASMGYGAQGTPDGTIPPASTLIFEVQLLAVQ